MRNIKLAPGQTVRIKTPQGVLVIEASPEHKRVMADLTEVIKPAQTLFYVMRKDGKSTPILDFDKMEMSE